MIATDIYLEKVPLPDGTPEEMAQAFVDIVNNAFTEDRIGMSKIKGIPMTVRLSDGYVREFSGKYFVILDWRTWQEAEDE